MIATLCRRSSRAMISEHPLVGPLLVYRIQLALRPLLVVFSCIVTVIFYCSTVVNVQTTEVAGQRPVCDFACLPGLGLIGRWRSRLRQAFPPAANRKHSLNHQLCTYSVEYFDGLAKARTEILSLLGVRRLCGQSANCLWMAHLKWRTLCKCLVDVGEFWHQLRLSVREESRLRLRATPREK